MRLLPLAFLGVVLSSGCAGTLSTLQIARPVEPKHFQITTGYGAYVNTGTVGQVIEAGINQAKAIKRAYDTQEPYQLNSEEQRQLLGAGAALVIMPPSATWEISVRTGLMDNWDVGLRYSVNAVRLDTKYRFFHADNGADLRSECPPPQTYVAEDGVLREQPDTECRPTATRSTDAAIGIAVSKHLFTGFAFKILEFLHVDDFSRWDVEVPLYLSKEFGQIFKIYAAPKYVYSHTSLDEKLVEASNQQGTVAGLDVRLPAEVNSHFGGASVGLAVGYKYVHLMLELTAGYTSCKTAILGEDRDLSGFTIYPAAGVNFRF